MNITYRFDVVPDTDSIISLYISSGIIRPTAEKKELKKCILKFQPDSLSLE